MHNFITLGKKIKYTLSATLLFASISGCTSNEERFLNSVLEYIDDNSTSISEIVYFHRKFRENTVDRLYFFDLNNLSERDRTRYYQTTKEVEEILIKNKEWSLLSELKKNRMPTSNNTAYQHYDGNYPPLLDVAGDGAYQLGNLDKAYSFFAKASLIEKKYANKVIGLAEKYGCTDLKEIWSEMDYKGHDFGGKSMPELEKKLSSEEIVRARIKLIKGQLPELSKSCPLSPDFKL